MWQRHAARWGHKRAKQTHTHTIFCSPWCSLQEAIKANMVPCLCDGCMYQSMSLLLWTMQQKPAIALVGLHSCVTWFIWHTDKDAFTNVVRLCMHVPIYTMSAAALGSFQLTALTCHMFTGKHVVGEGISVAHVGCSVLSWERYNVNTASSKQRLPKHTGLCLPSGI